MRNLGYIALAIAILLVLGVVFGIAGIFLLPLAGVAALIAAAIWMLERKATGKPPVP